MPCLAPEAGQGVRFVDWAEERGTGLVADGHLDGLEDDVDGEEDFES